MKSHIQFCAKYCRTNHKHYKKEKGDIRMVWDGMGQYIREKASKSRKKLNRQNYDRFYKGRKTFLKKA